MMQEKLKRYYSMILLLALSGCGSGNVEQPNTQIRLDSLEARLPESYKPGFGEMMGSIQVHHNKLWFAGVNANWKLAAFEIHEIQETLEQITKFQQEREESRMTGSLLPRLDSIQLAVSEGKVDRFREQYALLTDACNDCHRATDFGFNVVKIPDEPPFTNQEFKLKDGQ